MKNILLLIVAVILAGPVMAVEYDKYLAEKWINPALNTYTATCAISRHSDGEDPVQFYSQEFGDMDYRSMLAVAFGITAIGPLYIDALAEYLDEEVDPDVARINIRALIDSIQQGSEKK